MSDGISIKSLRRQGSSSLRSVPVGPQALLALVELAEAAHEYRMTLGMLMNLMDTESGRALSRLLDTLEPFDFGEQR